MTASFRCALAALRRGDPLLATASVVRRWLLVEEPGAWGRAGLTTSPIDPRVASTVAARAQRHGVRVQLIRRPGRRHRRQERRIALVSSAPGRERVWWRTIHADTELLDIPLEHAEDPPADFTPSREPIYLVCTHGRKDVCCAIWGRPVVTNLAAHRPSNTWETTHVGGDRFAPNLVVLPHGLYYGQLSPEIALAAVKAYEEAQVLPGYLRGRTPYPPPAQAAEHFARVELRDSRLHGLQVAGVDQLDPVTWRIWLRHTGEAGTTMVETTVRAVSSPLPAQLTCGNPQATHYRTFELVALQVRH